MKRIATTVLTCALLALAQQGARAESRWFAEGVGGLWISPDMDGFTVYQGPYAETIDGQSSLVGTLKAGYEFDESGHVVDLAALGGFYGNGAIFGLRYGGDASILFKLGDSFAIGPHAGLDFYPAPAWVGDLEDAVDFDPTIGGSLGVKATVGGERVRLVATLDYAWAEFDVDSDLGYANRGTLDMSGLIGQVGIQF